MNKIQYCNYCEKSWIDSEQEMVKECPKCDATVCTVCQMEGRHQGCPEEGE